MALFPARQRFGRVRPWSIAVLALAFVGLAAHQYLTRERSLADPALLQELQGERLHAAEEPARPPRSADWPQWRGPHRDGISPETGLQLRWPAGGPKVLWKAKGGLGYSALAIADGRAYTLLQDGDNEALVCWDADSGREQWRFRYPCRYENSFGSGPRATPTVDGKRVYTVGATGIFHCVNAETGEKLWRHDLLEEFKADNLQWGVSFSPLVEGDLVFTNPGGPRGKSLAAFHKETGELAWSALDDQAGYSSPVAATLAGVRQVLFFTAAGMVSVNPKDGSLYWRFPWETEYECNVATPITVGDYVFLSSGYGRGCALLKVSKTASGKLEAKRVYENNHMCNHFSTCVLHQDHLYGFNESTLTCLELRTGKEVWKEKGFRKGSLMLADGHLIVLGEQGRLAVAEATPEAYREVASHQVFRGKCWTMPVLAGGKLYLRDEEDVVCLDLRKP